MLSLIRSTLEQDDATAAPLPRQVPTPTPGSVVGAQEHERLARMRAEDGLNEWVLAEVVQSRQLDEFAKVVRPRATLGTTVAATVAGYGDIPWAGTCSVARSIVISAGDITYSMPSVPCGSAAKVFRNADPAGELPWGDHTRMNGPAGWDRFREAIAGAPFGFTCNSVAFLAWLRNPPRLPKADSWAIPTIGQVPLSALYAYQIVRPAAGFRIMAQVGVDSPDPRTLWVVVWDANRQPVGRAELQLSGATSYTAIVRLRGIPPMRGFVEFTPPTASAMPNGFGLQDVRTFPASVRF